MDKNSTSRLGKILLEKGIITKEQLTIAVNEQKRRRQAIESATQLDIQSTALGEVLIDLGFITRLQLKRCLNWQMLLRKMTLAMTLCAPLMTLGTGAAAQTTSSSTKSYSLPLTVQAEDWSSMQGVKTQATKDEGGGLNVGWIDTKDWMAYANYQIIAPITGNYKITYRVASAGGGGSFALEAADGSTRYDTVAVPNTGDGQKWVDVERTVHLTAGTHSFKINVLARGSGFNLNWFKVDILGEPLPVTIESESYSSMYGVQTQATTDVGGGLNVGWIHDNDWMRYDNNYIHIPTTGSYKVSYRVASAGGGGSFALHEADNSSVHYDVVPVPNTGGAQTWVTVTRTVNLTAGSHRFGMTTLKRGNGYNINWFKIEPMSGSGGASSSSVASSTPSSASSSSVASSTPTSSSSSSVASSTPTSSSSSSAPSSVSSSSSSAPTVSSSSSSVASSSSSSSSVSGTVALRWEVPTQRENGDYLDITEIGGYELRYKLAGATNYTYLTIDDPWQQEYIFDWLSGSYEFQIAVFDKNGLYSQFIKLAPL